MIPKETVDKILETAQIEEVVGEFVELKKVGQNLRGFSPFTEEKNPSFYVSPSKNIFKCFSSGKGGSVAKFLMEYENYTYPEALRYLAKKYGIEIKERELTEEEVLARDQRESLHIVLDHAKRYFRQYLTQNENGRTIGLSYLKERGLNEEVINKFELGFSPPGKTAFSDYAQKKAFQTEILVKAGLSIQTKKGGLIDRFYERIMFPIQSVTGRTLGFGGRVIRSSAPGGKYINSPGTDIYHKGKTLYGIYQSKDEIRKKDECIIVEGYTDVLSLHQCGIENIVAASGTSLTEDQIKIIKRYTHNVLFLFDGDKAGLEASMRGINMALAGGLNVKVLALPEGEDPDSFARENNAQTVSGYIKANQEDFILFKINLLKNKYGQDPVQQAKTIKSIVESISRIPGPLTRDIYIKESSKKLNVSESILYKELNPFLFEKVKQQQRKLNRDEEEKQQEAPSTSYYQGSSYIQEKETLRLLLLYGREDYDDQLKVAEYILTELEDIEWENQEFRKLLELYRNITIDENEIPDIERFTTHPDENIQSLVAGFIAQKFNLSDNWEKKTGQTIFPPSLNFRKEIRSSLKHLKLKKISSMIQKNQEELKNAKSSNEVEELLQVKTHLDKLKQEITRDLGTVIIE